MARGVNVPLKNKSIMQLLYFFFSLVKRPKQYIQWCIHSGEGGKEVKKKPENQSCRVRSSDKNHQDVIYEFLNTTKRTSCHCIVLNTLLHGTVDNNVT